MMVPVFLLWYWNPTLALTFFVFYSAWHFGQTELNHWGIENQIFGFLWGLSIFTSLFACHYEEFSIILSLLAIELPISSFPVFNFGIVLLIPFLIWAILNKKLDTILIISFFLLSSTKSLILTFGLYFIFQHSRIGWKHLKTKLKHSNIKMFFNALPFNIGAIILFVIYYFLYILI